METEIVAVDKENVRDEDLLEAAHIIRKGGLVAFPTETVYGLGANALDEEAAKKIYEAKGRPSDNPLIAHIAQCSELEPLVSEIPEAGRRLMEAYWPGPLTLVFPKSDRVPYGTTGGLDTVAVRMPSDPVARALIRLAEVPVAAPSANTSGRPSPTEAGHVYEDMNGQIDMILDGGPVGIGLESTIVDVTGPVPMLLRPGAITLEMLRETVGDVEVDPAVSGPVTLDRKPKAPGMKYRHYAPAAELILVEADESGDNDSRESEGGKVRDRQQDPQEKGKGNQNPAGDRVVSAITRKALEDLEKGMEVGILCADETRDFYPRGAVIRSLGTRSREETIAHNLFKALREFDDLKVDRIYSESFSRERLGQAIMNRLTKAAGYHVLKV